MLAADYQHRSCGQTRQRAPPSARGDGTASATAARRPPRLKPRFRPSRPAERLVQRRVGDVVGVVGQCLHANDEHDLKHLLLAVPSLQ